MSRRQPRTRRPGRPAALTEEVERRFLDAVRGGIPLTHAAIHAGVHPATFHRWMSRGEDADAAYVEGRTLTSEQLGYREFREKVMHARSQVAVRNVALVQKAAQGGYVRKEKTRRYRNDDGQMVTETEREYADVEWRAAKWLLETSFSREFAAAADRLELTGADGGPVQVEHSADQLGGLAERLALVASQRRQEDEEDGEVYDAELVDD